MLSGAEGSKEGDFTFRAYPLTDDKSFDNFFHPEKEEVLHLVSCACRHKLPIMTVTVLVLQGPREGSPDVRVSNP